MKLSKVIFTHPTQVFGGESVNVLDTSPTSSAARCDAIEATPVGLVITRGDVVAWVPAQKAESGIAAQEKKPTEKGKPEKAQAAQ